MSNVEFVDESGIVRLAGMLTGGGAAPGDLSLQAGPPGASLTLNALANGGDAGLVGATGAAGQDGGPVTIAGGRGNNGSPASQGAFVSAGSGLGAGGHGRLAVKTDGSSGAAGEALCSDGAGQVIFAGVQVAAAVPMGPPTGLPIALDTTAVTGGLYVWNGAAWVKASTIP